MLQNKDRSLLPLLVMLESIGKIEKYAENFDDPFVFFQFDDQSKFNASLLLLLNIGEQSSRISEDIRQRNPTFPFVDIRGLRNRIAHDYIGIDYEMVFDIITNDIKPLRISLTKLIQKELSSGTFDVGELIIASQSPFYKHIDFSQFLS